MTIKTLDGVKKLLEEKYMYYESLNDLEPDENPWGCVLP